MAAPPQLQSDPPQHGAANDAHAERERHWIFSLIFGEVRFQSEADHGTHVNHTAYTVPLWCVLAFLMAVVLAVLVYPKMVRELDDRFVTDVQKLTCIADDSDESWGRLGAASANLTHAAEQYLPEPTTLTNKSASILNAVHFTIRVSYWCRIHLPDVLGSMCPSAFPEGLQGLLVYAMRHPFEAWVVPSALLYAPRLTLLYLMYYRTHYALEELGPSTWFWLTWLLVPSASGAYVAVQKLLSAAPVAAGAFVVCSWRAQVAEWQQIVSGTRGTAVFVLLDGLTYLCVWVLAGLVLPDLALNMLMAWYWGRTVANSLLAVPWRASTPLQPPASRWVLHTVGQYLFSVWKQELPRTRAANYPPNYAQEVATAEDLPCCICCHHKKDTALIPCCHVLCRPCAHRLVKTECPFCHSSFQYMQFIRL